MIILKYHPSYFCFSIYYFLNSFKHYYFDQLFNQIYYSFLRIYTLKSYHLIFLKNHLNLNLENSCFLMNIILNFISNYYDAQKFKFLFQIHLLFLNFLILKVILNFSFQLLNLFIFLKFYNF